MKVLEAFIKPFEEPQRRAKIKIYLNFYFNTTFRNARDVKGLICQNELSNKNVSNFR